VAKQGDGSSSREIGGEARRWEFKYGFRWQSREMSSSREIGGEARSWEVKQGDM
jgi:hypothetical protein